MNRSEPVQYIQLPVSCRLALISDTHIFPSGQRTIPDQVFALFARAGVNRIVHLGDVATQFVLDRLEEIAPVYAVRGNNDNGAFGDSLPERIEFTAGTRAIRAIHGHGGRSARSVAAEIAPGADCVLYGHSHIPMIERSGDSVLVNPGSPSDRRWHPHFGVGFLEITEKRIRPELVLFTNPRDLDRITPGWASDRE
jgi:putative phosphoesterase